MDKDSAKGFGAKVAGSVKEAIGKVTGDTELEAEGNAQKATGKREEHRAGRQGWCHPRHRKEVAACP